MKKPLSAHSVHARRGLWAAGGLLLAAALILGACHEKPPYRSLQDIYRAGKITVITRNNAHCYYLYRDRPMGFEYDLAKAFARFLGVALQVRVAHRWDQMIPDLLGGKGDFIAASMTITPHRERRIRFSEGYMQIQQQIIVKRKNHRIQTAADLAGRIVDVRTGTSYQRQLEILRQHGIAVGIRLHVDTPTEELIRQVAEGKIEATIADSNIAKLNRRYYPAVRIAGAISGRQVLGWAFHPGARALIEKANRFFDTIRGNGTFDKIYNRYYANVDLYDPTDIDAFYRLIRERLPRYRAIIQETAVRYNLDWRLLTALIYQESHFDPRAVSTAGALGLMQLMPETAAKFGVSDIFNPAENIRAGVRHLMNFYAFYDKAAYPARLYIALAAYNIGQGHILDARNLARRQNLDPNRWESLVRTLPLLSRQKYFQDAIYGYCRGSEPIAFVKKIRIYYDILRHRDVSYPLRPS